MSDILLVEDSPEYSLIIKKTLEPEIHVTVCNTLLEAKKQIQSRAFELLLVDVGLPDGNGFDFLLNLKNSTPSFKTPVFFITGRTAISDQVLGYSIGADDYITKPFEPIVFKARVQSKLKKNLELRASDDKLSQGDVTLDFLKHIVTVSNQKVETTQTEFKLLLHFMRHLDQVFSRDQLMTVLWGTGTHCLDRTIDTHISNLRKKLNSSLCVIEPVHGAGYRFALINK